MWLFVQSAVLVLAARSISAQAQDSRDCLSNKDCASDRLCAEFKCINPCLLNLCGDPSDCKVSNHIPVCACKTGFSGPLSGGPCMPPSNKTKEGKKYQIHLEKRNWHAANVHCTSQGMRLATVENQEEQDRLANQLKQAGSDSKLNWWLGGTDLHKHKDYIWFSTGRPIIYKNFYPGQPDTKLYPGDLVDHCLEIREDRDYRWGDRVCHLEQYFVCEQ